MAKQPVYPIQVPPAPEAPKDPVAFNEIPLHRNAQGQLVVKVSDFLKRGGVTLDAKFSANETRPGTEINLDDFPPIPRNSQYIPDDAPSNSPAPSDFDTLISPTSSMLPDEETLSRMLGASIGGLQTFTKIAEQGILEVGQLRKRLAEETEEQYAKYKNAYEGISTEAMKEIRERDRRVAQGKVATMTHQVQTQRDAPMLIVIARLEGLAKSAQNFLATNPNSENYLYGFGLGSPARSAYQQQIQGAGHSALRALSERALASNNRVLGAVILDRLSAMPKEQRPFSASDFAKKMVGEQYNNCATICKKMIANHQEAVAARTRYRQGGHAEPQGIQRIQNFLRQREAAGGK